MLKFTVKGQASNKFMQYCSRTLWTTWSCSSKLGRITSSSSVSVSTPVLQWNMMHNLKVLRKLFRTTSISSVSVRLYTLMAPKSGNKKMKMERSNVGHEALIYLSFVDWWAKFIERIAGLFSSPKDSDRFELYFKMSRKTFNHVCSLVMEPMSKSKKYRFKDGNVMSLHDKVAIAIRRLKSGETLSSIGEEIGAQRITVSEVTWSFVEALEVNGFRHLKWPAPEEEMSCIKAKFKSIQGLPNCCGAIDITHIQIKARLSPLENVTWLDKMNNKSMVLQAIVDPDTRFRDVVCGYPGNVTGSSVLSSSSFFHLCERGERLNERKIKLSDGTELREYIVGDPGFPSRQWLVTPFQGDEISESDLDFNKKHFETWEVAPRALARLKEEWKFLQNVWKPDIDKLPRMILACCILHNIAIDMNDEMHHELSSSYEHDPGYQQEIDESGNKPSTDIREKLSLYLSGKLEPRVERAPE